MSDDLAKAMMEDPRDPGEPGFGGGTFTDDKGETCAVQVYSDTVRTQAEAIQAANIDERVWQVDRCVINKWDQGQRLKVGGKERVAVCELWGVRLFLKRIVPQGIANAVDRLFSDHRGLKLPPVKRLKQTAKGEKHCYACLFHDLHYGKYGWEGEVGEDTDSGITDRRMADAVAQHFRFARSFLVDEIVVPLGQDYFHSDNFKGTTHKGTPLDVDTRFQKVFEIGARAMIRAINQLRQIAPVRVLWVPGNHDRQTSWFLIHSLNARFHNDEDVTFDLGATKRKYHHYGCNLMGFTHGDTVKPDRMPGLMAQEMPEAWAQSTCRRWYTGHFHKSKEIRYVGCDTHDGVSVVTAPSLSGNDAWHYDMGFINNNKAADAYMHGYDSGFVAHFRANAKQ